MSGSVIVGDCLTVMKSMSSSSVQLVVTSPPYNIGKAYETRAHIDDWTENQRAVIFEAARIICEGGSICWQVGNYVSGGEIIPLDSIIIPILRESGLKVRNRIIWTFGHGLHASKRLSGRHESIVWATKGDDYIFDLDAIRVPQKYPQKRFYKGPRKGELSGNPMGKNPGDVWDIPNVKHNHPEKTAHPCQFPEALIDKLVLALSREGDLVLDPYAGSGTAGAVAVKRNRLPILIEMDEGYAAIATARLADAMMESRK